MPSRYDVLFISSFQVTIMELKQQTRNSPSHLHRQNIRTGLREPRLKQMMYEYVFLKATTLQHLESSSMPCSMLPPLEKQTYRYFPPISLLDTPLN